MFTVRERWAVTLYVYCWVVVFMVFFFCLSCSLFPPLSFQYEIS